MQSDATPAQSARFDSILRQVLAVPLLAVLLGAAALYWQIHQGNRTVSLIQSTYNSTTQTLTLERLLIDQETGLRGFQTTSNPVFLQPYNDARKPIEATFEQLLSASASDSSMHAAVDEIRTLHTTWEQTFAVPLIAAVHAGSKTSDTDLNLQGKSQMDTMRQRLAALNRMDQASRADYIADWQRQSRFMNFALLACALAIGLFVGLWTRSVLKRLSEDYKRSLLTLSLRAEDSFRNQQRLRITLAAIADGVIACNAEGLIQTMNAAAQQLTGWSEPEALGKPLAEVFPLLSENRREPLEDRILAIRKADGVVTPGENALLERRDGTSLPVSASGAPIRDKNSAIVGFVHIFRDVTLARKSQSALLATEKLVVAGRLAATIAHEIHNPLDSVGNLLFLMDGQCTPEEGVEFLHLAQQEIARVTQISRAMLSLYRESPIPIPIDLKAMLESVLLLMERRFSTLGVNVLPDLPEDLVILGFPAELRQVFTNLLTNAAEAAGPQGTVRISAEPDPDHRSADGLRHEPGVCITIEDDGPGIPDPQRPRLFQPFFSTKHEQGAGLGLWVSRGIITKHGGEIELISSTQPDTHGTTVSVFLATNPTIIVAGD